MSRKFEFKILNKSILPPVTIFLPVDQEERDKIHEVIDFPNMSKWNIDKDILQDLTVLMKDYELWFLYNGTNFYVKFLQGFVCDMGSVPSLLVHGRVTKMGQNIELAAMVHDLLYNQHLLPWDDANNIFEGIIEEIGLCSNLDKWEYATAVRTGIARRLYEKNIPSKSWMRNFYEWTICQ